VGIISVRAFLGSQKRPDLVIYDHVHLAVLHALIPALRDVPYAVFLHGIEVWEPLVGRRRAALEGANLVLANSATTVAGARDVNPWLPDGEITWLGVRGRRQPNDLRSTPPTAMFVGRIMRDERRKGHDAVLDAWPKIRAAVPAAKLLIVGTGTDAARLERRAKSERLTGVEFRGRISDQERDRIYGSGRLLFHPSKQEGFGLAGVEAASFGIPVLGLAGTVVEELFPSGAGAALARNWEIQNIAQAAIPVLADAQFASRLGVAGWNRVQANFLEEHFAQRFRRALARFLPFDGSQRWAIDVAETTPPSQAPRSEPTTVWSRR
jgi:phosphatidylinositol alpha-1,6-mannosyltransferase